MLKERLEHFVSRYAFNIEGLGKETIEELLAEEMIADPSDIFTLTYEDLITLPLFKEKKTEKILLAIDRARRVPRDRFLFARGIRQVGRKLEDIRRFDMTGFVPREEYLRAMKQCGVLTADPTPSAPVNPYELDPAYWRKALGSH